MLALAERAQLPPLLIQCTLPMQSSAGPAMATHAETTVELEFSSNTLITGGSFVRVEEGGVFHNHIHPTTGTEGRTGKYWAIL